MTSNFTRRPSASVASTFSTARLSSSRRPWRPKQGTASGVEGETCLGSDEATHLSGFATFRISDSATSIFTILEALRIVPSVRHRFSVPAEEGCGNPDALFREPICTSVSCMRVCECVCLCARACAHTCVRVRTACACRSYIVCPFVAFSDCAIRLQPFDAFWLKVCLLREVSS